MTHSTVEAGTRICNNRQIKYLPNILVGTLCRWVTIEWRNLWSVFLALLDDILSCGEIGGNQWLAYDFAFQRFALMEGCPVRCIAW